MDIVRDPQPVPPASAADSARANPTPTTPVPPEVDDATNRANELYRIVLDLRWGDAPDQRLHIETLRVYTPGPVLSQ
jgi:hypothetical protein